MPRLTIKVTGDGPLKTTHRELSHGVTQDELEQMADDMSARAGGKRHVDTTRLGAAARSDEDERD